MASSFEMRASQKAELFDLLKLKKDNKRDGINLIHLDELIARKRAAMEAEDVAYVEKIIAELK